MSTVAAAFVELLESYYGSYREVPGVREEIMQWIAEELIPQTTLHGLYKHVTRTISNRYNYRPDVVTLRQALRDMRNELRLSAPPERLMIADSSVCTKEQGQQYFEQMKKMFETLVDAKSIRRIEERNKKEQQRDRERRGEPG